MALNFTATSLHYPKHSSSSSSSSSLVNSKHKHNICTLHLYSSSYSFKASAINEPESTGNNATGTDYDTTEEDDFSGTSSTTRTQLDLLQQLSSSTTLVDGYDTDGAPMKLTIREKLAQLVPDRDDDFLLPLGQKNLKKVSPKFLTVSQKRNIKRQDYLNQVSKRNDSVFFSTIGAFVILPPVVILGIAILTGYVQLLP
ncbi:hypothetical protein ACFE04_012528 [Oxalis oulophora]